MNSRILKILISLTLTACLMATPAFGMPSAEAESDGENTDEVLQLNEEASTEPEETETFISEPEETSQDVEVKAESWRYEEGEVLSEFSAPCETEVALPEEVAVMGSADYGETANKKWTVGSNTFSGGYLKGIDVSVWQGRSSGLRSKIDWAKVRSDVKDKGVYDFVIIRCGYGKNTTSRDDSEFSYNVSNCEKYGIPYGVYLYSYAQNKTEAKSEAAHALRLLKGHYPDFPVYYDLEDSSILRATGSSKSRITDFAKIFCSRLDNNGYRAGIYASLSWFNSYIDKSRLTAYDLWVAQWPGKTQKYGNGSAYSLWQCSSSGSVSGIYGKVDINLMVRPYSKMKAFMTYDSLPRTLAVKDADCIRYANTGGITVREGPGKGFRPTGLKVSKRDRFHVSRTANGYSEITDENGNTGWVAGSFLVSPGTPWGFEKITEGEGEDAVTKTVLRSYSGAILKNRIVKLSGYVYGSDAAGARITDRGKWVGCKYYKFDAKGRAFINKSKTTEKVTAYAKAGSGSKGTMKKGQYFFVLKKSGSWSRMANGLWVKTASTKKTVIYPIIKPNADTRYTTTMKERTRSYSGPSTSYIKKQILDKNRKVTVVGTYGNWAKLTTETWVPKSRLK
ncbi:MAG: hypothetical protein MJ161_04465 [Clostridia bacterium]|nr:hypothetical protein [Clostridia bacterium]